MIYLKWALLGIPSLLMAIVGRVLAPFLPFFVQENGFLPRWLWWFQTPDNPCDGDAGHWERWPGTDAWSTYKRRVAWFLRNVGYGFDIDVLGVQIFATDSIKSLGDPDVDTDPIHSGWNFRRVYRDGECIAWHLYFVFQYPFLKTRCLRGTFGWKLFGYWGRVSDDCLQWSGMVNPLKSAKE